jgi:hypothetical protein
MSYYDDPKMKLLKEAWAKIDEGDITYGAKKTPAPEGLKGTQATGTAVNQAGTRQAAAKPPAGVENLAEGEEEETGAPASAEDIGAGDAAGADIDAAVGADDLGAGAVGAEVGNPWDQLVTAVDQMKSALEAIAAEESGEEAHMGGEEPLGDEGDAEVGGEEDIAAVAEQYLEEAKKKLKEKAFKAKAKGFVAKKK